jgi:hypothetical protein
MWSHITTKAPIMQELFQTNEVQNSALTQPLLNKHAAFCLAVKPVDKNSMFPSKSNHKDYSLSEAF